MCLYLCFSRTWVHVALNWTPFVLGTVLYLRSDGSTCPLQWYPLRKEFWWSSSSAPIQLTRQDCSVRSMCTEVVSARHADFQASYSKHWSGSYWVCRTHFATPYPHHPISWRCPFLQERRLCVTSGTHDVISHSPTQLKKAIDLLLRYETTYTVGIPTVKGSFLPWLWDIKWHVPTTSYFK